MRGWGGAWTAEMPSDGDGYCNGPYALWGRHEGSIGLLKEGTLTNSSNTSAAVFICCPLEYEGESDPK